MYLPVNKYETVFSRGNNRLTCTLPLSGITCGGITLLEQPSSLGNRLRKSKVGDAKIEVKCFGWEEQNKLQRMFLCLLWILQGDFSILLPLANYFSTVTNWKKINCFSIGGICQVFLWRYQSASGEEMQRRNPSCLSWWSSVNTQGKYRIIKANVVFLISSLKSRLEILLNDLVKCCV